MPDNDEPETDHTAAMPVERTEAFRLDSTQAFSPGTGWRIADRYRVIGRIGAGGMADVFRAHDELLQRDVAVKVFRAHVTPDTAAGADRQRAELLALARLNHPHLITLYDGAIGQPSSYLVMELIEGPTLADRIEAGPVGEHEIRVIGRQVADALAYVHDAGMVHRDVKPANILLGSGGATDQAPIRARLSDFGIVRLLGTEGLTSVDTTVGTASYLAPEQARGSGVGPPADVYALGLTLLEAFTRTRAFEGASPIEAAIARLERDPLIPQQLPAPWPGLLAAMTAREPAARPPAAHVAQALRNPADATTQLFRPLPEAGAGTSVLPRVPVMPPVVTRPPVVTPPPHREERRSRIGLWIGIVLALLVLGLGIAIVLATTSNNNSPAAPSTTPSTSGSPSTSSSTSPTSASPTSSSPSSDSSTPSSSSVVSTPPSTPATSSTSISSSASTPASSSAGSSSASSSASSSGAGLPIIGQGSASAGQNP